MPDEADVGPSAPAETPADEASASATTRRERLSPQSRPLRLTSRQPTSPLETSRRPRTRHPPRKCPPKTPALRTKATPSPPRRPSPSRARKDVTPGADLEPLLIEEERELSAEERARLEAEQEEAAQAAAAESDIVADEPALREGAKLDLSDDARIQATGKRKTAIARVVIVKGGGEFLVNRKTIEDYFPRSLHQTIARQALTTSGYDSQVDVKVRVHGGGVSGQADAVRHATARALIEIDPELRGELKRRGMLTRDAREKERRKAGFKKARKKPQFSKR